MLALLGMIGLSTEGGLLLYKHRQMQTATDTVALSAAAGLGEAAPRDAQGEGRAVAAQLGYRDGINGTTVSVINPPTSGRYSGEPLAVEVKIAQPQSVSLFRLFTGSQVSVGARSVATRSPLSVYCVLALNQSASPGVHLNENAQMPNPACGVATNSASDTSMIVDNNALIAGQARTHGRWVLAQNAILSNSSNAQNSPIVADPYEYLTQTVPAACDYPAKVQEHNNGFVMTLNPGRYCHGWKFWNQGTLNLNPGVYYIDEELSIKNNVTINGTGGVTLVISSNYAIDINNNAAINITAPTTGDYAGIAMMSLRNANSALTQTFENNAVTNIQGVLYFPAQNLIFSNNATTSSNVCSEIVAGTVLLKQNVVLGNNCTGTAVKPIGLLTQLVE